MRENKAKIVIMNGLEMNQAITTMIRERFQQKSKIVTILSDLLGLGSKAVYRRLNNEVFFTFSEVCKLSTELGIPLDGFVQQTFTGINLNGVVSFPKDAVSMHKIMNIFPRLKGAINRIVNQTYSEMNVIANSIPSIFYCYDKELLIFNTYKTNYRYVNNKTYSEFKEDKMNLSFIDQIYDLYLESMNANYYSLLINRDPVRKVLQDMSYMKSICSLTLDEYESLKKTLRKFVDQIELIADSGYLLDSDTLCDIYLSDIGINPCCYHLHAENLSISSMQMYILGWKISFDRNYNKEIKNWFDLWKQNSVLITKSNKNERRHFLEEQRKLFEVF